MTVSNHSFSDGMSTGEPTVQAATERQIVKGLGFCKAPTVTTGAPGSTRPDATEGTGVTEDSPESLLRPLLSINGPYSSLEPGAGLHNLRTHKHDQLKIPVDVMGSTDTDFASDSELHRSLRNHGTEENKPRGNCKVGRPIAYCGDPNSPNLTPAERRRIMRRIANRESARRVRARRLDVLNHMTQQAKEMEDANARLMERLTSVEHKHNAVLFEAQELNSDLQSKSAQNEKLQAQLRQLRASLSPRAAEAAKRVVWSASGLQYLAASECSFLSCAENLVPPPGMLSTAASGTILFNSPRQGTLPDGCALLSANPSANGDPPGGAPFSLFTADAAMPPQLEPIERSFSEFLNDELTRGSGMA